jgi:hypothetical protein
MTEIMAPRIAVVLVIGERIPARLTRWIDQVAADEGHRFIHRAAFHRETREECDLLITEAISKEIWHEFQPARSPEAPRSDSPRVVVYTNENTPDASVTAWLACGATDVLRPGLDDEEFFARLHGHLQFAAERSSTSRHVAEVENPSEIAASSDFTAELIHQFNNSLGATLLLAENLLLLNSHLSGHLPMNRLADMVESITRYSVEATRLPGNECSVDSLRKL